MVHLALHLLHSLVELHAKTHELLTGDIFDVIGSSIGRFGRSCPPSICSRLAPRIEHAGCHSPTAESRAFLFALSNLSIIAKRKRKVNPGTRNLHVTCCCNDVMIKIEGLVPLFHLCHYDKIKNEQRRKEEKRTFTLFYS